MCQAFGNDCGVGGLYKPSYSARDGVFRFTNKNSTMVQEGQEEKSFDACHISSESVKPDQMSKKNKYTGMIVYDIGSFPAKKQTGHEIHPAWILIKDSKDIENEKSNE